MTTGHKTFNTLQEHLRVSGFISKVTILENILYSRKGCLISLTGMPISIVSHLIYFNNFHAAQFVVHIFKEISMSTSTQAHAKMTGYVALLVKQASATNNLKS